MNRLDFIMASENAGVMRFGPFQFDPATGDLWTAAGKVRLQDQPRQVLALLASRHGQLVTRDELRAVLWPNDTFVDFDTGINVAINKLRVALGDSAAQPVYIETIPRKGYRFLAGVVPAAAAAADAPRPRRWWMQRTAIAAVAAVVVIGASVWAWRTLFGASPVAGRVIRAVAVLPLANFSGDSARDYFVEGLTDTLRTELASLAAIDVVARPLAARDDARHKSPQEIARELDVDALVEGSVVAASTGFAVNIQIVDGRTGKHVFADRFVRADWSVIDVPVDLLHRLARSLGSTLPARRAGRVAAVPPEALHAYLRARYFWNRRTGEGDHVPRALDYLTAALRAHPTYALAWAALADVYASAGGPPSPLITPWPGSVVDAGIKAAEEALRLDPTLGEAHAALGRLHMNKWRWEDALREARLGVELSPGYSTARQWYGTLLMRLGRCDAAIVQVTEGARLDALTPLVNEAVGSVYMNCGETQRAIATLKQVADMFPEGTSHHIRLGNAYTYANDHAHAVESYRRALVLAPHLTVIKANLAYSLAALGRLDQAKRLVSEVEQAAATGQASAYHLALAYAAGGDAEKMLTALERAYQSRDSEIAGLILQRRFWRYQHHERFQRVLERSGLLPYWKDARLTIARPSK